MLPNYIFLSHKNVGQVFLCINEISVPERAAEYFYNMLFLGSEILGSKRDASILTHMAEHISVENFIKSNMDVNLTKGGELDTSGGEWCYTIDGDHVIAISNASVIFKGKIYEFINMYCKDKEKHFHKINLYNGSGRRVYVTAKMLAKEINKMRTNLASIIILFYGRGDYRKQAEVCIECINHYIDERIGLEMNQSKEELKHE